MVNSNAINNEFSTMTNIDILLDRNRLKNNLRHIIKLGLCHARINSDPEAVVHDKICIFEVPYYTEALSRCSHLIKARMLDKVTGEEHSRLNILRLDVRNNLLSVNTLAAGHDKSEPATIRIRLSNR